MRIERKLLAFDRTEKGQSLRTGKGPGGQFSSPAPGSRKAPLGPSSLSSGRYEHEVLLATWSGAAGTGNSGLRLHLADADGLKPLPIRYQWAGFNSPPPIPRLLIEYSILG